MFDTFTIFVKTLPVSIGEPRTRIHPVMGPLTDGAWHHHDAPIGEVRNEPCEADAYLESLFPAVRSWTALECHRQARAAASDDREWVLFQTGLASLLTRSMGWIALVESDCDQYEIDRSVATVDELLARVDQHRCDGGSPLAILMSSFG